MVGFIVCFSFESAVTLPLTSVGKSSPSCSTHLLFILPSAISCLIARAVTLSRSAIDLAVVPVLRGPVMASGAAEILAIV
jgi:hypothetical protein